MSALTRGVIGVCTLGGVCGGGYGLHKLLSNDSIESKLKANEYILLTDSADHEQYWTEILKNYKLVAATDSPFKFKDFTGEDSVPAGQPDAKSKLKELCKKTTQKRTFEDDKEVEYNKAKKWCVVPKTASEMLKAEGLTILDTKIADGKTNPNSTEWTAKVKDYIKSDNTHKITQPAWEGGKGPEKSEEADIKKFMQQCEKLHNTKTYEQHYETIFKDAKRWCAI
ncbi:hypothetical protein A6V39_00195 [Candidatus Mycoplasma haematobovis]|uniref:Uncharacterized protein n=1 Tax=Candidatus Mycoplasma haematobovis TaxID=432608 RepID=A0A1A9QFH9_9MOLU|nr:hypothetical protein [Candidatus Mycoplasma haematobovis]OAL10469.1 hypothetical protein A6V39_00195 [Candidatus Mycoplasma haematobovis]